MSCRRRVSYRRRAWAVKWRQKNALDGETTYLIGTPTHPCRTALFETRQEARDFVRERYGYIRERTDLQAEPHGWRMPTPVQVDVIINEIPA